MPRAVGQLTIVLYFEKESPTLETMRELMYLLLEKYPRMRSYPVRSKKLKGHCFTDETYCDKKKIVDIVNKRVQKKICNEEPENLADIPLPEDELWGIDILEKVVVFRLDHSLSDGLRLLRVASDLLRNTSDNTQPTVGALRKLFANKSLRQRPSIFRLASDFFKALLLDRILLTENAPLFHSRGSLLPQGARIHAGRTIASVRQLKMLCKNTGATINDILICALSAAMTTFVHGDQTNKKQTTRALLAVAAPLIEKKNNLLGDLFNNFVMPSLDLPILDQTYSSRSERLKTTKARLNSLKSSTVAFWMVKIASLLESIGAEALLTESQLRLFSKHSCVISNVPGYDLPVSLAGQQVLQFQTFFPNIITQILFLSYNGQVTMTISAAPDFAYPVQQLLDRVAFEISDWFAQEHNSSSSGSSASMNKAPDSSSSLFSVCS
mmetsp:Transcript_8056/g.12296  ORF Transcript_8056/g.12296 Transcript_8056/m.12296 type:complete len:439 (+) Transcript_8056:2-1318(+)